MRHRLEICFRNGASIDGYLHDATEETRKELIQTLGERTGGWFSINPKIWIDFSDSDVLIDRDEVQYVKIYEVAEDAL
jgi:hypothetical protein